MTNDDMRLVREYALHQSESAFATLVSRHTNLVYSAALRQTHDPQLAEEVTQVVFILLARKAASLSAKTILTGWLYRTAGFVSGSALKRERRRQNREQEAYMQSELDAQADSTWNRLSPLLDEAMLCLGQADRDALVMRYFEGRSLNEVGSALGTSEDAAKKRVNRALEKLRKLFGKRGVTLSAALIAGAVSAGSVQAAPAGLAATISTVALTKGAATGGSTLTLVKGALKIMAWTKVKMAVVVGASVLFATGTATMAVKEVREHWSYSWQVSKFNYLPVDAPALLAKTKPQVTIVRSKFKRSVDGTPFTQGDSEEMVNGQIIIHTNQSQSIGLGVLVADIIKTAYDSDDKRTIIATPLPKERYDFIVNIPHGGFPALQQEIEKRFGVVGKWMPITTNALALVRIRQDVQFKPATARVPTEWLFRGSVENSVGGKLTVVNDTGLTNRYEDVSFKWPMRRTSDDEAYLKVLNKELRNQLGFELVHTNLPIEMLVVDKVK